ncbi:MAG: methyl-accepting chemotaxis protein [Solirubrobacteraceae bacterium]
MTTETLLEPASTAIDDAGQTRAAIVALAHDASHLSLEIADVAANVNAVSDAAVSQTAAFEQIRASTAQLLETTRDSAVAARAAGEAARDATGAARDSTERITASLTEVHSLARWSADAAEQLQSVVAVIAELRKSTGKLSDIAEQTNILSLNARIEAARSGEHGLGFAVIADHVRALSVDAKETTKAIDGRMRELVAAVDKLATGGAQAAETAATVEAGSSQIQSELGRVTEAIAVADQRVEVIAAGALETETALGDVDGAIESVTKEVDEQTTNLTAARDRINSLRKIAERVIRLTAEAGVETIDTRMIQVTRAGAARFEQLFEEAVASRKLTLVDLFDEAYKPIAGSDPQQYRTRGCRFLEQVAPSIQEPILDGYEGVRGSCLHDRNGFRPMMNVCFSQNQGPDPAWNAKYARHRAFATDEAGLAASRNTEPVLVQAYRRTAMGKVELTKEASVPVFVRGRHWGNLRTVYVDV